MRACAAVVVSYETRPLLDACLTSLATVLPGLPVTVVDSGSTDGSADLVRERHGGVRLVALGENQGFAAAANRGLAAAEEEFVLLLNGDTALLEDPLPALLDRLRGDPRLAAAGPRLVYPDGRPQESRTPFPRPGPGFGRAGGGTAGKTAAAADTRVAPGGGPPAWYLMGAALLLRREALRSVGLFDEAYFFYLEEVDWFRRAHAAGWGWALVPEAVVVHHHGASVERADDELAARITGNWHRSRLRYARRHGSPGAAAWLRIASLPGFTARWLGHGALHRIRGSRRSGIRAAMWRRLALDYLAGEGDRR